MKRLITISAFVAALTLSTGAEAASFNCGRWLCSHFGIAKCGSLALALQWAKKFPHTMAQPNAVVVQRRKGRALGGGPGGHVSKIVSLTSNPCRAIVVDNRGRYERDICKNRVALVAPSRAWTE